MFIFFPCCCSAIRFISISSEYSFLFYLPNVNATPIKKGKQLSEKQMVMTAWRKKAIFCIFSWWFYSFLPCSCKFEGNILKWNSCPGRQPSGKQTTGPEERRRVSKIIVFPGGWSVHRACSIFNGWHFNGSGTLETALDYSRSDGIFIFYQITVKTLPKSTHWKIKNLSELFREQR